MSASKSSKNCFMFFSQFFRAALRPLTFQDTILITAHVV